MAGLPPLRYLRKSTALLALIFLIFFVHRVLVEMRGAELAPPVEPTPLAQSVLCRNIVGGAPFGADSVFFAGRNRVYVVSKWTDRSWGKTDSLRHLWYRGGDVVLSEGCRKEPGYCSSSLAPEQLTAGDWSVDLVWGTRLLSSRQFRVLGDGP